jgi:hypothetical protein
MKMKTIEISVILTFCRDKEYGSQEMFEVGLSYGEEDKSAKALLNQSKFFDTIVQIINQCDRLPTELIKISTSAGWSVNGFEYDIGDGKWSFGSYRGQNIAWSDSLAQIYGFGEDDCF